MPETEIQQALRKLDRLINLFALSVTEGKKQREQILLLSRAGFQPKDIAEILGTSSNAVRVELSKLRKEHRKMKRPQVGEMV